MTRSTSLRSVWIRVGLVLLVLVLAFALWPKAGKGPAPTSEDPEAVYQAAADLLKNDSSEARLLGLSMMRVAADSGSTKAQSTLGYQLAQGENKDLAAAVDYLAKAALAGDRFAIQNLRRLHEKFLDGHAEERGKVLAALNASADAGFDLAAGELGYLYYQGSAGLEADPAKAMPYLQRAADAGDADSANTLGVMFSEGIGTEKSEESGARYYRLAAEAGHPKAQASLGLAYALGRGVAQDMVKAFAWMRLSALQDEVTGKNALADYIRGLNWQQVHEGHQMVAEFLRGHGTNVTVEQLDAEIWSPPPRPAPEDLMPATSTGSSTSPTPNNRE